MIKKLKIRKNTTNTIISKKRIIKYFDQTLFFLNSVILASNWIINDFNKATKKINKKNVYYINPKNIANIINLIQNKKISNEVGKQIFFILLSKKNININQIIHEFKLKLIDETMNIEKLIKEILNKMKNEVQKYKSGKKRILTFFVGKIIKKCKGRINPKNLQKNIKTIIEKHY
jgi:aspartyl-tRNA(Asn)/glutamyl-tRNA(Gln) amidotransferase subunit B